MNGIWIILLGVLKSVSSNSGPSFIKEPPPWVTFTNSSGQFIHCRASGVPPPTIQWIGLDHSIIKDISGIREVWPNGTLAIFPFNGAHYRQDVHAGILQCKAQNPLGSILAPPTTLRAVVIQQLEIRLYDEYVITGNTAVLRCVVPSYISDLVSVTSWEKDNSYRIYPSYDERGDGKHQALPDGRLFIFDVTPSDSFASYTCLARHQITLTEAQSNKAKIIVSDPSEFSPPQILTKEEIVKEKSDSIVIIPCVAHSHPPPRYRWFIGRKGSNREPLLSPWKPTYESQNGPRNEILVLRPGHELLRHSSKYSTVICEAYNDAGLDLMEVEIEREFPVNVEITPKHLTLNAMSRGQFHCKVTGGGHGGHFITWYKNSQILVSNSGVSLKEDGTILEIQRAKPQDIGMYQCFVKVNERLYQNSAELKLGASPPHFLYRFIQQTLTPGPAVSLKCISGGSPTPTISWTLDGFDLPSSERIIVGQFVSLSGEVISHVNISSTRVEDGGEFSCTAKNSAGAVTHSAPLYIYGPPHVRDIGSLTAVAGKPFKVRCPAAGYPVPNVIWTKDGRQLPLSRRHDVSGPELKISKVSRESDEGHYVCTASDRQGRVASKSLHLKVVEPPKVAPFSLPSSLTAGSRVAVQCVVQGDPPVELLWYHNHQVAYKTPGVTVTPLGQFVLALVIDKVAPIHAGNYTCKVKSSNRAETSDSHSSTLRVNVAPRWRTAPKDVSVVKGEDAILDCDAEGFPAPSITWRRASKGKKPNTFHHTFDSGIKNGRTLLNGSLLLKSVTEKIEGSYLCEVSNGIGSDLSSMAFVNVQVPPLVNGQEKIEIRKGNFVNLNCQALGDGPLTLSISKDGQPIDSTDSRFSIKIKEKQLNDIKQVKDFLETNDGLNEKHLELTLVSASTEDSGEFKCTATNPFGSHTHVTTLIIQDVPEAPRNLRLLNEGSRDVTINWTPALSPNAPILSYVISTKKLKETWENSSIEKIRVKGNSLTADIKSLLPSSSYQVRISAVNSVGESPPSEALTIRTKGEAPRAPPQNIRAIPLSSTKIKVEWSSPDPEGKTTFVQGYYIGYREQSSGEAEDFHFEKLEPNLNDHHSWAVGGLKKYRRYEFVVQAYNSLGSGPLSRVVHATTHEDIPEAAPTDISCTPLTSQSLELTWLPPPEELTHGKIISYSIVYYSFSGFSVSSPKETHVLSGKSTILSGLQPFANYSIAVAASTKAGTGRESKPVSCLTEEDIPDPPAGIKGLVSGSNEVVVVWSDPFLSNGKLTKFTIYIQTSMSRETKRRMVPAQSHHYDISNLVEGEELQIWVTASTRVGEGNPTKTIAIKTSDKIAAGIKSLGEVLRIPRGSDVLLLCPFLGVPTPSIIWSKDDFALDEHSRWKRQPDGGLLLHDSRTENAGNYSCHVRNIYGSDTIFYQLIIMVPPSAPRLRLLGSTTNSLTIKWQLGSDGGAPVEKLTLTWRPDHKEWREENLERHTSSYTLENLLCGTTYHLYLSSQNAIGSGAASEMVSVKTKGDRPTTPAQHKVITVNESAVLISLSPFNDSDCPVLEFFMKVKPSQSHQWITFNERLKGLRDHYTIANLYSGEEYDIEITAKNSAGETTTRYSFRTVPTIEDLQEDPITRIHNHHWMKSGDLPWSDPAFTIPVILSSIALVAIIIAITICIRRKSTATQTPVKKTYDDIPASRLAKENFISPTENIYYSTMKKTSTPPLRDIESIDTAPEYAEDIYPYATFELQQHNDGSTLQTLVFQDPRKASIHTVAYHKEGKDRKLNHGRSLSNGSSSDYARVRRSSRRQGQNYSCVESEESISDTDTDPPLSARTESSSRIDARNAHNLLYLTSDASTIPSPPNERKSLPCHSVVRPNCIDTGSDMIYGISTMKDILLQLPPSAVNHRHKAPSGNSSRRRKGSKDEVESKKAEEHHSARRNLKQPGTTFVI